LGLNGRLQVGEAAGRDPCKPKRVAEWLLAPACPVVLVARLFSPSVRFMSGPFLMEGDFVLGIAGQDTLVPKPDPTAPPDTNLHFQESAEGYVRIEVPVLDFGGPLSLRGFGQGGFVVVRGRREYWEQRFWGFRLGIDAVDVSGRQSFVEIAWGASENLTPVHGRMRVTAQLRVPRTELVFQFGVNRGAHPNGGDSPVVFSIYSPLDFGKIRRTILGSP